MRSFQCFLALHRYIVPRSQWAPWQPTFHQLTVRARVSVDTSFKLLVSFIESRQRLAAPL